MVVKPIHEGKLGDLSMGVVIAARVMSKIFKRRGRSQSQKLGPHGGWDDSFKPSENQSSQTSQ
jgi:hypothetical protein